MSSRVQDDIDAALSRIEESGRLGERSRLRDILRYLVAEERAGRGERISGYSIGIDVLGRPDDFDPNSDSIVRTEMNRLRQALELYFGSEGKGSNVTIEIPKGSYRPRIDVSSRPTGRKWLALLAAASLAIVVAGGIYAIDPFARKAGPPQSSFNGPRIMLASLVPIHADAPVEAIASGLSFELTTDLTQYSWLAVSQLPLAAEYTSVEPDIADFVLSGEVSIVEATLVVTVSLSTTRDRDVVWTKRLERPFEPEHIGALQRELAYTIATALGQREGIVPTLLLSHRSPLDAVSLENFVCLMSLYGYWEAPTEKAHAQLRDCLIETTTRSPEYAEAWAALGFIYLDEGREGLNPREGADPWQDASRAVDRALDTAPLSSLVLNAAMTVAAARPDPDYDALRRYGERELEMRPNSAFTLANFGAKLALNAGDWKEGMLLHARARDLDRQPPSWVNFAPAYEALLFGSEQEFAAKTAQLQPRGSTPVELLRALSARQTGDQDALSRCIDFLKTRGIATKEAAIAYVKNRRFSPELTGRLIEEIKILPGI